jgi:hypothetical protein
MRNTDRIPAPPVPAAVADRRPDRSRDAEEGPDRTAGGTQAPPLPEPPPIRAVEDFPTEWAICDGE